MILIVGAGPTGLTAAVELARRGIACRIIDRKEGPTPLSKAVGISSHSLDLLEPSDVTGRLLAQGIKVRQVHFFRKQRELGIFHLSALPHRFNFLLSLPQSETETIMAQVLAGFGVDVEWRTELKGLEESEEAVTARIAVPGGTVEETRFGHVFGADGAKSAVRNSLGIAFDGYEHKRRWSIADVEIAEWPYEPLAAQGFLHGNGDVGFIIPIGENRFRAFSNTDDALARIPGRYTVSKVLITDTFHLPIRQAARYQTGRVFLGGDAAHVHSPLGARGMNLGMEDAASFARRFAEGELSGYSDERRPVGKRWIALSERILSIAQSDNAFVQALRDVAFFAIGHVPALQKPLLQRVAGLKE